ncbi:MAG: hypothetical protein H0T99_09540 [Geodermatophilaceae bacterium]|nr:hypothetical protein [Geodermatophilaceae bacterium]MDQ3475536.1 hypothetical protein [Actinomycetota bacterium]
MPDQLRESFAAFRNAVERTDAAGLHDVRVRRTRRTRNRVVAASAATVAAFALAGVVVLPRLPSDDTTSAASGQAFSDSDAAEGSEENAADNQAAEELPDEGAPAEEAPVDEGAAGAIAVAESSLLTWDDIQAVGETGPGALPYGASLVLPALCDARSSYEQYSVPTAVYSAAWALTDARLDQAVIEYDSDQQAADALARLVQDSPACPVINEFASIEFTGNDASLGSEVAFFDLQVVDEDDESSSTSEITVTRISNVLVEVVLTPDGPVVADDRRSAALAEASIGRILTLK